LLLLFLEAQFTRRPCPAAAVAKTRPDACHPQEQGLDILADLGHRDLEGEHQRDDPPGDHDHKGDVIVAGDLHQDHVDLIADQAAPIASRGRCR
jgi:hypothetical protein